MHETIGDTGELALLNHLLAITNLVLSARCSRGNIGAMLSGSITHVTSAQDSDVDVIYLLHNDTGRKGVEWNERWIDYQSATYHALLGGLNAHRKNDHKLMVVLSDGVIVNDHKGKLAKLRAHAQYLWQQGPPTMSAKDHKVCESEIAFLMSSARRCISKADGILQSAELARMRMVEIYKAIYIRELARNGKWMIRFMDSLQWTAKAAPLIHDNALSFVSSVDIKEMYEKMSELDVICGTSAVFSDSQPLLYFQQRGK